MSSSRGACGGGGGGGCCLLSSSSCRTVTMERRAAAAAAGGECVSRLSMMKRSRVPSQSRSWKNRVGHTEYGGVVSSRCGARRMVVVLCQSQQGEDQVVGANEKKNKSKKNVLVVGNGGREHALAWKIRQSPECAAVFMTPSRAPIVQLGDALDPSISSSQSSPSPLSGEALLDICIRESIDLVVIGPEVPLVDGAADMLRQHSTTTTLSSTVDSSSNATTSSKHGVSVVGPSALAARLEGAHPGGGEGAASLICCIQKDRRQ